MAGKYSTYGPRAGAKYRYYSPGYLYEPTGGPRQGYRSFQSTTQFARQYGASRPYRYADEAARYAEGIPGQMARGLDAAFMMRFAGAKQLLLSLQSLTGWATQKTGSKGFKLPPGWCQNKPRQSGPCAGAVSEDVYDRWSFSIQGGPNAVCGSESCPQFASAARALPVDFTVVGTFPFNAVQIMYFHTLAPGLVQEVASFQYPAGPQPTVAPTYDTGTRVMPVDDPFDDPSPMAVSYGQPQPSGLRLPPYAVEAPISIEFSDDPGRPVSPGPPVHILAPPRRHEKEDKPSDPTKAVGDAYGFFTEVNDALRCLEKNIKYPKGKRYGASRQPLAVGMADRVSRVVDQTMRGNLDIGGFMQCFAQNQLTDSVIGGLASAAQRKLGGSPYNPRRGLGVGMMGGGFSARMR